MESIIADAGGAVHGEAGTVNATSRAGKIGDDSTPKRLDD